MTSTCRAIRQMKLHKPDARSGSYGIGRANHASRSPLPDSQGLTSLPRRFLTSSPPL